MYKRQQHGLNEVEHERPVRWWRHLWLSYNNPFNLLLTLLAAVSCFTRDTQAAVVIGSMVPVSYTHLRAHETVLDLVCRLLLEKKNEKNKNKQHTPNEIRIN